MIDTHILPTKPSTIARLRAARFETRWTTSSVAVVSAYGDIDASNANTLTAYAMESAARCQGLILCLSGLEFFGTDGFTVLHRLSVHCAHAEIGWMVVPGPSVSRLLRICDPHGSLPTVDSVGTALANLVDAGA